MSFSNADSQATTVDILGVGVGPFNLGLAALLDPLIRRGEISARFLDSSNGFSWHPGVMFPDSTIQVPFLADLVTMADPTSRYSFLNDLKQHQRLYPFYIRESFYPYRSEYSDYCAWVASQLDHVHWDSPVETVRRHPDGLWEVIVGGTEPRRYLTRNVVNGTGTEPVHPEGWDDVSPGEGILHSSDFLFHEDAVRRAKSVTIVGSGQSAAEIYRHLMEGSAAAGARLDWFTRSPRFFPMEYTALTLEMTSPDYVRHFHRLPERRRDELNRAQRNLYKGISGDLVNDIYDTLYRLSLTTPLAGDIRPDVTVTPADPLTPPSDGTSGRLRLHVVDGETGESGIHATDVVILATGYGRPQTPPHLEGIPEINRDDAGRMAVERDFTVNAARDLFVLNAEEHTHSLNAPDLGMGPWRNSIIINRVCGREVYPVEESTTFQRFGGEGL